MPKTEATPTDNVDLRERAKVEQIEAAWQDFPSLDATDREPFEAGYRAALSAAPIEALQQRVERLEVALWDIRKISSKPTYPGNNCRDIDSIARAALGDDVG